MRCLVGIELEQAHANAERDCMNALNAVKTADACMAALEKAVLVQVDHDALITHIRECKICRNVTTPV
jgi:hypothetical protein